MSGSLLTRSIDSCVDSASYLVVLGQPPYGGSCSANTYSGIALQSNFTLTCSNWEGTVAPQFLYSFTYQTSSTGPEIPLTYASLTRSARTHTPPNLTVCLGCGRCL